MMFAGVAPKDALTLAGSFYRQQDRDEAAEHRRARLLALVSGSRAGNGTEPRVVTPVTTPEGAGIK